MAERSSSPHTYLYNGVLCDTTSGIIDTFQIQFHILLPRSHVTGSFNLHNLLKHTGETK